MPVSADTIYQKLRGHLAYLRLAAAADDALAPLLPVRWKPARARPASSAYSLERCKLTIRLARQPSHDSQASKVSAESLPAAYLSAMSGT